MTNQILDIETGNDIYDEDWYEVKPTIDDIIERNYGWGTPWEYNGNSRWSYDTRSAMLIFLYIMLYTGLLGFVVLFGLLFSQLL